MEDTAKYLIHADLVADGVIERSDVVGAAFGQTEGLLGDDLDIRDLQDSAKLGRIDVSVDSEGGQSFGHVTIASSLDRVETATLAAALEAVERVGPCRAQVEVQRIEDVRAAKRREVVDRAKELLANAFDEGAIDSEDILREVRESVRVEDVTDYEGYPAGPNVESSDAVVVVEGRADVVTLLGYGIKNAVAVEGTNVPEEIADLTRDRTVTAFLDGDRGGDLVRQELEQVAAVDYVARAPAGESVEDLSRQTVDSALREKTPVGDATPVADETVEGSADGGAGGRPDGETDSRLGGETDDRSATAATDGSATPAPATPGTGTETPAETDRPTPTDPTASEPDGDSSTGDVVGGLDSDKNTETGAGSSEAAAGGPEADAGNPEGAVVTSDDETERAPKSLADHVDDVVGEGTVRLLGDDLTVRSEADAGDAFDALEAADATPTAVVVDDAVTQRLVDLAAQRGVGTVVGTDTGEFVKQPANVRVHDADAY